MGDFNSEPNKRLRLTPPLASRGAGTIIAARKCTEDERSESEGTFERSENPKGAQACASGPRQNTGRWARVRRIFTTEYTEAVEPLLKDTERDFGDFCVGAQATFQCIQW